MSLSQRQYHDNFETYELRAGWELQCKRWSVHQWRNVPRNFREDLSSGTKVTMGNTHARTRTHTHIYMYIKGILISKAYSFSF
jgi:hypothetical protein